jgi:DNA polymerase elongation subunit (family B)
MFGDKMTMASVALPMLRSYHGFEQLSAQLDEELRPYYFGGRNQCFATGVLKGDFKVYDINSSYPDVMRRYNHPISDFPRYEARITEKTHFAKIRAWSLGALPIRKPDGGLDFPIGTYDFFACIHEIKAGLETKTLKIHKVYHSIYFDTETNFAEFIDEFYKLRLEATANKDEVRRLFYKLVMNSSYGKFAQDPRKYENWLFDPDEVPTPAYCFKCHNRIVKKEPKELCVDCDEEKTHSPYGWYLHTIRDGRMIYAAPQKVRGGSFFNVATAASITSAARASLLRGIQAATRPVYCDTDSIICEHLEEVPGIKLNPQELGAWDTEARGDTVAIAGKKLYAIFDEGKEIKKASKGVKLTAKEILRVCQGEVIEYAHPVPKFKLNGETMFTTRNIRATGM